MVPVRFIADLFHRWRSRLSHFFSRLNGKSPGLPRHLIVGTLGEKLAADHLRRLGYKILYRNFHPKRGGEIDLVCRDRHEDTLVFVEVKSRASNQFGPPHFAVTQKKRDRIIRGAKEWLRMLDDPRVAYRFDIVEVIMEHPPQVTLLRNAFGMRDDLYD